MEVERKKVVRILIFAIAFVFIFIGLLKNENMEVQKKASKICLECIGIG